MNTDKLKEILDKHQKWLNGEPDGERANLYGADLRGADLRGANLRGADLNGADLRWANLNSADLRGADLRWANLNGADLRGADLRWADLRGADLRGADLNGADLRWANLNSADLRGADLRWANLNGADLYCVDLYGADLYGADLRGADLNGAKIEDDLLDRFLPICCPEYGSFIAWKKARGCIVKLEVTDTAKRSGAYGRKCRCSEAKVLAIEYVDGSPADVKEVSSGYDHKFVYRMAFPLRPDIRTFLPGRNMPCPGKTVWMEVLAQAPTVKGPISFIRALHTDPVQSVRV